MDLTLHLTTRADDSHATPVLCFYQRSYLQLCFIVCQEWVRFCACVELNHMLHRLCGSPSIPLSFSLATVLPRRGV